MTSAPASPAANRCRGYFNTTTGLYSYINSSGGNCGPSGSGGTPGVVPDVRTCPSNVDAIPSTDRLAYVTESDASPCAVSIAQAGSTGFTNNFAFKLCNAGTGVITFTPTVSNISYTGQNGTANAASSMPINANQCAFIYSNNTNYLADVLGASASGGGGGGNPVLENCTPDQSGNSFYTVSSLTNYFFGHWEFVFAQPSFINCTIFIPTAQIGATLVLDIAANDGTAGHTANFQTCDQVINSGTINIGALTCAANQTFTTTSTANNRVTLTFNVQSTLSNNSILVVKIATSTTGTAPTANMTVYPHFIL